MAAPEHKGRSQPDPALVIQRGSCMIAGMKISRRSPWLITWLLFLSAACAQPLVGQQTVVSKPTLPLWKIQGRTNAVYLLGSIHFCKSDFYPLAKPIEAAYQQSGTVVFEADLGELESIEVQTKLLTAGMLPADESLSQHLSKETYAALQAKLQSAFGQEAMFDRFRPWLAAVSLSVVEIQKLGFDPRQGIDKHFYEKARTDGKQIVPLETVEFQLGLFTGLSKEDQELFLKSTLEDIKRFSEIFSDVIQSWKTGDAKKLEALLLKIMKEHPALYKKLLTDRNRDWLPKVEKLVRDGKSAFVVVGMGHLVGEQSLVDLLRKNGVKVEQQ
jgi:uncharacterized protein